MKHAAVIVVRGKEHRDVDYTRADDHAATLIIVQGERSGTFYVLKNRWSAGLAFEDELARDAFVRQHLDLLHCTSQ